MKRNIELIYNEDNSVSIAKARGKLTIDDIIGVILNTRNYGQYVIVLNCTEDAAQGDGYYYGSEEPVGDGITIYPICEGEPCPVCTQTAPLLEYCPHCGGKLPQRPNPRPMR